MILLSSISNAEKERVPPVSSFKVLNDNKQQSKGFQPQFNEQ